LTGVIYAAIVVAWAAYLVPLALRRHDEAARSRSIERFSSAMRVLARRGATSRGRSVVTPKRDLRRLLPPDRAAADAQSKAGPPSARPNRAALRAAAARRRRVLCVLLALTAVVGALSAFALVPLWSSAVPLGLVVVFLVVARRQVRRASEDYWVEASAAEPPSNVVRRSATRVEASHGAPKQSEPADRPAEGVDADHEPTVTLTAEELAAAAAAGLDEERVLAVAMTTSDGGSLWDPLPVTLPTYVDKPVARRSVRTIELDGEGVFSAGHDGADAAPGSEASSDSGSDHSERAVETAKVVNG
jgi:hypothetical protein